MAATQFLTIPHLTRASLRRIFGRVTVTPAGCWEMAPAHPYGTIWHRNRKHPAHRLLYAWLVEPVPHDFRVASVDHFVCDNPPCCNPAHMRLVTHRDNVLRGRGPTAANAKKTHCVRGHLLPAESNVPEGRRCLECQRINRIARYHQRMASAEGHALRAKKRAQQAKYLSDSANREAQREATRRWRAKRKQETAS